MTERVHHHPALLYTVGTQIVTLIEVLGPDQRIYQPKGAVGVVVSSPTDSDHSYRVRFPDGAEFPFRRDQVILLGKYKQGDIADSTLASPHCDLFQRVIYRCIIGSQAYGLSGDESDVDRRGIYLAPAELHWSIYGVPEQLENETTQEAYWELQKFLVMALKANPNVLECLYSPLIETKTELANELLQMRSVFLSRLVYQTYNGYVMSQFKKMQSDIRNQGQVKWKHLMHLIRLLLSGIEVLKSARVQVHVGEYRAKLLAIRRGEVAWDEVEVWRKSLHDQFSGAYQRTSLPERPDYERVNAFLVHARTLAANMSDLP